VGMVEGMRVAAAGSRFPSAGSGQALGVLAADRGCERLGMTRLAGVG